ncbi:TetR/AcrR family transcriptional regulator, partial [Mycobacteroides abscessus subsp. abscessus]|nr:TetR/AcrR family transcriptional regulator [Mycobacteroides abscessus subsp. abscessus]
MATPRTSSASEAAQSGDGDTDATSQPAAVSALSDDDLGSSAQRERRKRILDATLA